MDSLVNPGERKTAEAFAIRNLEFYNQQAGKNYSEVFEALSVFAPGMRYQARQRIAGRVFQSHKKGDAFQATRQGTDAKGVAHFQIFTVFLSPNAPGYIDWTLVKALIREMMFAHLLAHIK